jgi:hypothetical protein
VEAARSLLDHLDNWIFRRQHRNFCCRFSDAHRSDARSLRCFGRFDTWMLGRFDVGFDTFVCFHAASFDEADRSNARLLRSSVTWIIRCLVAQLLAWMLLENLSLNTKLAMKKEKI